MNDRFLFIGDAYCGPDGETWQYLADLLLCEHPAKPLQFHFHNGPRVTLPSLYQNCPRDIIGRQAGSVILCAGYQDLAAGMDATVLCGHYDRLLHEIAGNSLAKVYPVTLYLPDTPGSSVLNNFLRNRWPKADLIDFAQLCGHYQKLQTARGEQQRNLQGSDGTLGHLGQMLLARYAAQFLPTQFSHLSWGNCSD